MKEQEEIVSNKVKEQLHVVWKAGFEKEKGVGTPRFKPVPETALKTGESPEKAKERFEEMGLPGLKIEEGKLQQNINTSANNLVPALNEKLNGGPAKAYTAYMMDKTFNDSKSIEQGSSGIHEVWKEQNEWQKESTPELFEAFEKLPAAEKIKDLDVLEVGVKAKGEMDDGVKAVFDTYRAELDAQIKKEKKQADSKKLGALTVPSNQEDQKKPTASKAATSEVNTNTVKRSKGPKM